MAARRAHNPEAVGSSPTPAKVVSGLSSEQKPPIDVVSRPEMKLGNPFCGAKAPEWVAIVFLYSYYIRKYHQVPTYVSNGF